MSKERIERFMAHFSRQLELVEKIEGREFKIHRKLLYVSLIDTLAGLIYPTYSNRKRFVATVTEFGQWDEHSRISIPHLVQVLKLNPAPAYKRLRELAYGEFAKWHAGARKTAKDDLPLDRVAALWPKEKEDKEPLGGVLLESLKHAELLYVFRNAVVHSFTPPGTDFEMPEDDEPYYLSGPDATAKSGEETIHWDLIYPAVFVGSLTKRIFTNVRLYLIEQQIDPFPVFSRGRYWLIELNK